MAELKIALVHLDVKRRQPEENLKNLLELFEQAADEGAQMLIGPEMSLSGYIFDSRHEIAPLVQSAGGPAAQKLAALAADRHIYLVAAWAERDEQSGIFYNSAFVFGADGRPLVRYRKVNGESRWARPGASVQNNVFETPWGRMGVLVCADSYHSLLARVTALKGADLIIIPANWPQSGLDPAHIWRLRAWENGCYLAVANRTGQDQDMDCRSGHSCVASPAGDMIVKSQSETSAIFYAQLPLDENGRLAGTRRAEIMASRRPELYYRAAGNFSAINDLTRYLKLPQPGLLDIHCLTCLRGQDPLERFEDHYDKFRPGSLVILPRHNYSDEALNRLELLAGQIQTAVITARKEGETVQYFCHGAFKGRWQLPVSGAEPTDFPFFDFGPARIMLADLKDLIHPELALAAAKWGCDLAACSEHSLTAEKKALVELRPIDQIAVAACGKNAAAIGLIPQGHQAGRGSSAGAGDRCDYVLDTHETRRKRFQERVDFDTLFSA